VVSSPEYISISPAPYKSKKYTSDFTTPNFRKALALNRPVDDWGKLLGDTAAVTALLDRLLHHAHVLKCGPRSWRTKVQTDLCRGGDEMKEVLQSRSKLPTRGAAQTRRPPRLGKRGRVFHKLSTGVILWRRDAEAACLQTTI
jgi:hypothetical protein